ncbi:pseudouridine synthase [Butyrivibrio sp. VCB2006]|uniref:pseudouridine synthase n=1 Tax=Butyrivibrio sp. VCB2006 TaxID=1280679 RepID=UPI00041284D6|nr:pseudouridine synthase [Butyrivibrio sp. VCB2006]
MRLNQYIAACGVCSRREADKLVAAGRVKVNGSIPQPGLQVEETDEVYVDNKKISLVIEDVVLAYYKPIGVVCTEKDSHAERCVTTEINYPTRVTYAGRLDKDSEGLLILSNDGNLINAMMKSSNKHEKEYEVEVDKEINGDFLKKMANGVYLEELDRTTRGCKITKTGKKSFRIILTQGLNRQIRRMCQALGANVVKLKRIRVMTVKLADYELKPGQYKELDNRAKDDLYRACGLLKK